MSTEIELKRSKYKFVVEEMRKISSASLTNLSDQELAVLAKTFNAIARYALASVSELYPNNLVEDEAQ